MTRYKKIVFKVPEGMSYITTEGENGELIFEFVGEDAAETKEVVDTEKYFTKITEGDRQKVKDWLQLQIKKGDNRKQVKLFLELVEQAIQKINYDYWIAALEPSVEDEKIFYAEDEKVGIGFSCRSWSKMANEYAPERGSRLAELHELFIWYALRIINDFWSLEYVTIDSSSAGNYLNAPGSAKSLEKTGARKCGGYSDGQGNTYKIVVYENNFMLVGGRFNVKGNIYQVADVGYAEKADNIQKFGSAVLVLTR